MKHYSVLLKESIDMLNIQPNGIYIDGTLGRGGHSAEILKRLKNGHLYAFDRDDTAIQESRQRLSQISDHFTCIHSNFSMMKQVMDDYGIDAVDGILLDLGVSSPQFDEAQRGFSYRFDAPLDMRMNQQQELSAAQIVNTWSYEQLVMILNRYGEEKFAKQIARAIERQRALESIQTTYQLVDVIKSALPQKVLNKKGHPAKKVFQAIRIAVNDELGELEKALNDGLSLLKPNGRFCVISFHSLEDRMVKQAFACASSVPKLDKRIPLLPNEIPTSNYKLIHKKPITADETELNENNRSHSAKLRTIERI